MKLKWIGPGNYCVGDKLIPPDCPEAIIEMAPEAYESLNARQKARFENLDKPRAKPEPKPKPKVQKLANK